MEKIKVLFVCVHNSARSQMAEAFMNRLFGDRFTAESAGLEPGTLNPLVITAMQQVDIDIRNNTCKDVFDIYKSGKLFHYIITVCNKEAAEKCPVFPGGVNTLNWSFEDPSQLQGTYQEKIEKTLLIRDQIKNKIVDFATSFQVNN